MKLNYNVTGENRKQMVAIISWKADVHPVYTRMPECAFLIGDIKVSKTGELIWDERTDEELIGRILEALSTAGFRAEEAESTEDATETQEGDTAGDASETLEADTAGDVTETRGAEAAD